MNIPLSLTSCLSFRPIGAALVTFAIAGILWADEGETLRKAEYRHVPPLWHTPVGMPGDWHKPLVDEKGALVYDFGPGPYARPGTRVGFRVNSDLAEVYDQTIEDARVPILRTDLSSSGNGWLVESMSLAPQPGQDWADAVSTADVQRRNGLNHCLAWADPPGVVDPAFRNVALGTNRLIQYRIRVLPGQQRRIALGFADPYREPNHRITRIMELRVEGATMQEINVVDAVGQNRPFIAVFDASDDDQDGWIEVQLEAARRSVDGNLFINAMWVFAEAEEFEETKLIRGELSAAALHYVDCGQEPQILARPARYDLLHATRLGTEETIELIVSTKRQTNYLEETGELRMGDAPWVVCSPRPVSAESTEDGWRLTFSSDVDAVIATVVTGGEFDAKIPIPEWGKVKARAVQYWQEEAGLPWGKIVVPDVDIQAIFDGSVRTLYQLTERVDGQIQTQPGPSVYRGLWVSNQPRASRALTHLGDFETARSSILQSFKHQRADGRIVVLTPDILLKETGTAVHSLYLHARISRDPEFLSEHWSKLAAAGEWLSAIRREVKDPEALNYGLMPAGLSDGGVGGVIPEYTSVQWSRLAVENLVSGAQWLGRENEAVRWRAEAVDFEAAYRRAAARDMRPDEHGNWFQPVRMEFDPEKHVPQRSQVQLMHMIYPGRMYNRDDLVVTGTLAMLGDAPRAEGMVLSTGWLDGGVQPFIESIRAQVRLFVGEVESAQDTLYAVANHASPTHVWIEEQLPGFGPRKATGDVPHSSAASEFINLVRYFIAIEDGDQLDLLKGVPREWIKPSARIRAHDLPTEFGRLTLSLDVSVDGSRATLRVESLDGPLTFPANTRGGPRIYLGALKEAGFRMKNGESLPDVWGGDWGNPIELNLECEIDSQLDHRGSR